jgi:F-type H+-transporting ATPase subunit b
MRLLLLLIEGGHEAIPPWKFIVSQLLGFGLLAVLLWVLVRPILAKMLAGRTKGIEDSFTNLENELAETSRKLEEYNRKLSTIEKEIQGRLAAAQAEGEKSRATLMTEAATAAVAETERAKRDVQVERDKAVLELRAAVTEATVSATVRIIEAVANEQLNGRMVDRYLGNLEKAVK